MVDVVGVVDTVSDARDPYCEGGTIKARRRREWPFLVLTGQGMEGVRIVEERG